MCIRDRQSTWGVKRHLESILLKKGTRRTMENENTPNSGDNLTRSRLPLQRVVRLITKANILSLGKVNLSLSMADANASPGKLPIDQSSTKASIMNDFHYQVAREKFVERCGELKDNINKLASRMDQTHEMYELSLIHI
eukprot:TRINITY_DN12655_c0_g1_i2.p1 TRINITY_DN12655_c0_g1~~TRINITY_DN12655_c0_g1_i2.p1  ORF type:complete len:161 (-),score=21.93 TRINITY_DN12655_c0_g1_i2:60-476(-)